MPCPALVSHLAPEKRQPFMGDVGTAVRRRSVGQHNKQKPFNEHQSEREVHALVV